MRRNGTSSSCSSNRLRTYYQTVLWLCISTYFFQSSYQQILTLSIICYQTIFNTFSWVYISNNTDTFRKMLPKILNSFCLCTSIITEILKEVLPNAKSLYQTEFIPNFIDFFRVTTKHCHTLFTKFISSNTDISRYKLQENTTLFYQSSYKFIPTLSVR